MLNKYKQISLRVKSTKFALSKPIDYDLASYIVSLLYNKGQEWWNGRHEGLKILWPLPAVWVRVPLPVQTVADYLKIQDSQPLLFSKEKPT